MLSTLVCGTSSETCIANSALDNLSRSIDRFTNRTLRYLEEEFGEEAQIFGAFCGRVVLENSCAALLGRLDPFRLIYLSELQSNGGYQYGRPTKSGFRWSGDVLADERILTDIWADHDLPKVSRALFSRHMDHMFWRPAVTAALDFASQPNGDAVTEFEEIDPDNFINLIRGRFATLYSIFSKGVHWDFFCSSVIVDESTIKDSLYTCLNSISLLAFVSHFVPTAYRPIGKDVAWDEYKALRSSMP